MKIYIEKIPQNDYSTMRLGRNIEHDSRSLSFGFDTSGLEVVNVTHERYVHIFDQGNTGSCCGNAGIGAISTHPFIDKDNNIYTRDEQGAIKLYSNATALDEYTGTYPPDDTGSNGLTIGKVLLNAGLISSYQHTFTLQDALKALSKYPIIVGIPWYTDMFNPDPDGRVHPTGNIAGGHEIEGYKVDVDNGRIHFFNSWSDTWGKDGTFYLTWEDFNTLLGQQGDVVVLIPPNENPAPVVVHKTVRLTSPLTKSEDVKLIQQILGVKADGYYGKKTEAAVKNFQTQEHIKADGVVGKVTWRHLLLKKNL